MSAGGEKRDLSALLARVPGWLVCLGAAAAVVALGALLVWYVVFSGFSGPAQFIYGGF